MHATQQQAQVYYNTKQRPPVSGNPRSDFPETPPAPPPETALRGPYSGLYRVEGFSLRRSSDGLQLVVCPDTRRRGPRCSDRFLVNASAPKRPRVGYLYGGGGGLDGAEFDDETIRYRLVRVDDARFRCVALYRKAQNRGGRRG